MPGSLNGWLAAAGLSSVKPTLTALLLPPTPFVLVLAASLVASRWTRGRKPGRLLIGASTVLLWMSCCTGSAEALLGPLLHPPPALTPERLTELRRQADQKVAIIVLGGGLEEWAPEYVGSNLTPVSLERLRYGVWLARKTRWPVGFSGGVGWGQAARDSTVAEATVARHIAAEEYGVALNWVEDRSRDTRENAINTVQALKRDGISKILIVTDAWHMPRAVRNFQQAAEGSLTIEAAPMALASRQTHPTLRWMPSGEGLTLLRQVIRERVGLWTGA